MICVDDALCVWQITNSKTISIGPENDQGLFMVCEKDKTYCVDKK
jgi:hypothetical protein